MFFQKAAVPKAPARTPGKAAQATAGIESTGHVDSPATIVITKKVARSTPKPLPRKGRKSGPKAVSESLVWLICFSVDGQLVVTELYRIQKK